MTICLPGAMKIVQTIQQWAFIIQRSLRFGSDRKKWLAWVVAKILSSLFLIFRASLALLFAFHSIAWEVGDNKCMGLKDSEMDSFSIRLWMKLWIEPLL